MDFHHFIGIAAGIIGLGAYGFYIKEIISGKAKPSRSTWFIWGIIGVITAASYKAVGADATFWLALAEAIGPITIAIIAIKYGVGGLEKIDIFAFSVALVSILLWWYFALPIIALLTTIAIDFFAITPTMYRTYKKPEEEGKWGWSISEFANFLNILAINKPTFGIIIYPVYTFIIEGIQMFLLFRSKEKHVEEN